MLAYHNDPAVKAKYLSRVAAHRAADELVQGTGWERGKGCAVGCTLEAYDHRRYPVELGIPESLAHLEDRLFELQSSADAQRWPERFLGAIAVGADLSRVWFQWAHWMLVDPEHGVIRYAGERKDVRESIVRVAALCESSAVTAKEWRSAAARAADAAADAAYAAARAAYAAARAADAAYAAARAAWVTAACDKLIALLESAR